MYLGHCRFDQEMRTVAEDPSGSLGAPVSVGGGFPWGLLLLQGSVALVLGVFRSPVPSGP